MASKELDSFLVLRDKTGTELAFDDDSGGEHNALFVYTPVRMISTPFSLLPPRGPARFN